MADAKCSTCSELGGYACGIQKGQDESQYTYLPKAAGALTMVKRVGRSYNRTLDQCPECGDYFYYESTYEYLVTGSEDCQSVTRLSAEEAAEYLAQP